jgi:hypothetical protein
VAVAGVVLLAGFVGFVEVFDTVPELGDRGGQRADDLGEGGDLAA